MPGGSRPGPRVRKPGGARAAPHSRSFGGPVRGLLRALALPAVAAAPAAVPAAAHEQDIEVRAFLSASQVGVGRQFVLNVEVTGTQQLDGQPELPDMDDFADYLGSGSSSSFQMANGRTTV